MYLLWTGLIGFVIVMLALDLGVFHRKAHAVSVKEAFGWSILWVSLALLFGLFIFAAYSNHWFGIGQSPDPIDNALNDGRRAMIKYYTGYVVELSLSMDNIMVIAILFQYFCIPSKYQHRVLFWGILGAIIMRGVMIGLGSVLIAKFHFIIYVFGAFLILTSYKIIFSHSEPDPEKNLLIKLARRFFPVTRRLHGESFTIRSHGHLLFTPLTLALIAVETTDLIFAIDSIPAIFGITGDPYLVFSSNIFAILGLRSMYFALAAFVEKFRYLKPALGIVLFVVGIKMIFAGYLKDYLGENKDIYMLLLIGAILAGGVLLSIIHKAKPQPPIA